MSCAVEALRPLLSTTPVFGLLLESNTLLIAVSMRTLSGDVGAQAGTIIPANIGYFGSEGKSCRILVTNEVSFWVKVCVSVFNNTSLSP